MGDINNTPDFSLSDLNVDGDLLMKDADGTNENGSNDTPSFVIDSIQGNYSEIDEPLTTEDILKTINDITSKEGENVDPLASDEIESTLQQAEATSDFVFNIEESDRVLEDAAIVHDSQENTLPKTTGENEDKVEEPATDCGGPLADTPPTDTGTNEDHPDKIGGDTTTTDSMAVVNDSLDTTRQSEENAKDSGVESEDKTNDSKIDGGEETKKDTTAAVLNEDTPNSTPQLLLNGKETINNMKESLNKLLSSPSVNGGRNMQNRPNNSSRPSVDRETALKNRERQFSKEKMEMDPIGLEAGITPEQVPSPLTPEEVIMKNKMFSGGCPAVQFVKLHCTACNVHLGSSIDKQHLRYVHPVLKVLICKDCYLFYTSGDFDKDEDGSELYCRWCGQGGNVMCCSYCEFVFCKKCIRSNLGKRKLEYVKNSDDWVCCVCDPSQILKHKLTLVALFEYIIQELKRTSTLNCPELRTNDYASCCREKTKPQQVKRTSTDDIIKPKKKAKKVPKVEVPEPEEEDKYFKPFEFSDSIWGATTSEPQESQQEEEVVCAPDLSMLMGDDDSTQKSQSESPIATTSSNISTPPLTTSPSILSTQLMPQSAPSPTPSYLRVKNVVNMLPDEDVQIVGQFPAKQNEKNPGIKPRFPNSAQNVQRVQLIQPKNNTGQKSVTLPPFIRIQSKSSSKQQPIILNTYANDGNKPRLLSTFSTLRPLKFHNTNGPVPRFVRAPTIRPTGVQTSTVRPQNVRPPNVRPPNVRPHIVRPQTARTQTVRPVFSTNTNTTTNNVSYVNNIPARFLPGLKHEWFDTTVKVTSEVYMDLAKSLTDLGKEKDSAKSIEGLAGVHNKLQEVLSSSINTLIQVRRNLRSEFIKGLNQIKANQQMGLQSSDVIVVASSSSSPVTKPPPLVIPANSISGISASPISLAALISSNPATTNLITIPTFTLSSNLPSLSLNTTTSSSNSVLLPPLVPCKTENKPMGYLKVKSVSQLLNVPSECITIPDMPKQTLLQNGTPIILNKLSEPPVLKKIPEDDDVLEISANTPATTTSAPDSLTEDIQCLPVISNVVSLNEMPQEEETDKNESAPISVGDTKKPSSAKSKEEFEKCMKDLMEVNLRKYKYPVNLSVKDLKYMLTARVHVQDMCKMSILQMLLHKNENADLMKVVNKASIGLLKKKLTNKLRIGRVRSRSSRKSLYAIINSPTNSNSASASNANSDTEHDEWNPHSDSETENVISD